jgi:hypothetical protein
MTFEHTGVCECYPMVIYKCQMWMPYTRSSACQIQMHQFNPPTIIPTSAWSLEAMTQEFTLPNPISRPNNAPVPQNLMFIGALLCCSDPISAELCILLLEAPRFEGFITGYLSHVSESISIPPNINRFGAHTCFGYHVLEDSFRNMKDLFDTISKHCGVTPLTCPASTPPPSPGWELSPLPVPSPMPQRASSSLEETK